MPAVEPYPYAASAGDSSSGRSRFLRAIPPFSRRSAISPRGRLRARHRPRAGARRAYQRPRLGLPPREGAAAQPREGARNCRAGFCPAWDWDDGRGHQRSAGGGVRYSRTHTLSQQEADVEGDRRREAFEAVERGNDRKRARGERPRSQVPRPVSKERQGRRAAMIQLDLFPCLDAPRIAIQLGREQDWVASRVRVINAMTIIICADCRKERVRCHFMCATPRH